MKFTLRGDTAVFGAGKNMRGVQTDGKIVRVFDCAVELDPLVKLDFNPVPPDIEGDKLVIGGYTLCADEKKRLTVRNGDGAVVYSDYAGDSVVNADDGDNSIAELEGHKVEKKIAEFSAKIDIRLDDGAAVYGLGDKAAAVDRRGYEYVQWNTDDPSQHNENYKSLYKSINFVVVSGKNGMFGLFCPCTYRTVFNIGKYKPDLLYIAQEGGKLDYYIILGDTPKEIVSAYTALVGRPLLPRLKMLGFQQSRWSYGSQAEVEEVAEKFVSNDLPLDYIHIDIDYMDGYRVYTVDKNRFPDIKGLTEKLGGMGIELVSILDPGVKYDTEYFVYKRLEQEGGLATYNGEIYHNEVWPGDSVYPDYFDMGVSEVVAEFTSAFMDETGVTGIWCDMNEPASFKGPLRDDVMFGEYPHRRVHNLYGDYMVRAVFRAFEQKNIRPYIITRACFATTARYTTVWNGDNQSLWAHLRSSLPQIATMNLCGFPLDGVDIGGFGGDCTKELAVRWIEANIFSPLIRNHSAIGSRRQEPYAFDGETLNIYKKFLRLRYDLIPYLYDLAYRAHLFGEPIVRPMFYSYPDDKNCARISDEVMIGDSLLLAPILDCGAEARAVYFPEGRWKGFPGVNADTEKYKRGYAAIKIPLDSTGLFYNRHCIIPMYSGLNNLSKKPNELIVFLGGKSAEYINYEDDGKSVGGMHNEYKMTFDGKIFTLSALIREYDTDYKKLTVVLDGKKTTVDFDYKIELKIK
ncbi:MAG: alpha-glucosidase [Clostridiales bacterium]|nr:alpha-glucosidase [Clostridiales bacterium]